MSPSARYAVLSDIHGNVLALQAVIAHAQAQGVRDFINLGDIVYGPLWPNATRALLETIAPLTIQGNQDREIFAATAADIERNPTLAAVITELSDAGWAWLRALPQAANFEVLGRHVLLTHGTPTNDCIYLLEEIESGQPQLRSDAAITALLDGSDASLILCGHSHLPRCVMLADGRMVVNPGSVGVPAYDDQLPVYHRMQTGSPLASYAIISITKAAIEVAHHRVAYDVETAVQRARSRGRNDWAAWLARGRAGD